MEKKLPKGLSSAVDKALAGEALVAGAVLENDPVQQSPTAVLLTAQRLMSVGPHSSQQWPLEEVAVTDYQEGVPGNSAVLAVLAGEQVHRFAVPRNHPHFDLRGVYEELNALDNPAMAAKVTELAWWDGRAGWPYGALGRVAGGSTELLPGERGTLRLVQGGVHLYPAERPEPSLQLPWVEVTSILVEGPDELSERLGAPRVAELDLLAWGLKTTGGECFVSVTTKHDELYYAAQAPPAQLRQHWAGVLAQFTVDPDEVVVVAASPESDLVGKLERLAALHARGVLTPEEFAAAKAAVIAGR
ncbi:MAG TPA: SHOCT domain-containing protein [Frankiaceae bacterium]|nr:SHOCT domain-containing protein [Frankiaceae bacterium]